MSKSLLRRRSLLKCLGSAAFLATPVFRESLAAGKPPLRLILLNLPGGVPHKKGTETLDTDFTSQFKPLAGLQSDSIVFDNVENAAGEMVAGYFELEGHGGGCRSMFGGAVKDQGCGGAASCGDESLAYRYGTATTIDQLLAQTVGQSTTFNALHFGTLWDKGQGGDHAECFFNKGRPVRPMADPKTAFSRLFPNRAAPVATTTMTMSPSVDPSLVRLHARGKSRLDTLAAEISEIKVIAGKAEQAKLDEHLTSIRELERRLPAVTPAGGGMVTPTPGAGCAVPNLDSGTDIRAVSSAFNELAYQAINCDLSRIVALQWLSSGDHLPRFGFLGLKLDHHTMEHSEAGTPASLEYFKAQTWILEQMAAFVAKLKATPEGDTNMLDNSIVYLASEMGQGQHILSPALSVIFGKAGGLFKTGRRIDATGRNINDVLLTIMKAMGHGASTVGDAMFNKGPLNLG